MQTNCTWMAIVCVAQSPDMFFEGRQREKLKDLQGEPLPFLSHNCSLCAFRRLGLWGSMVGRRNLPLVLALCTEAFISHTACPGAEIPTLHSDRQIDVWADANLHLKPSSRTESASSLDNVFQYLTTGSEGS